MKNLATLFLAAIFLFIGAHHHFVTIIPGSELSSMIASILFNIGSIQCFSKLPNNQASWQFIRCVGRLLSELSIISVIWWGISRLCLGVRFC